MKIEERLDRLSRWARNGDNRKGSMKQRSEEQMTQEDLNGQSVQTPEMVTGDEFPQESVREVSAVSGEVEQAELKQLRGEREQLMDRLARLQAEFENARKREVRERADARDYTISNAVEPFLGVMDNFQLALKSDGSPEQLRGGIELILKQMEEALRGLNVQPVESVGAQFDPRIHEALGSIETKEFPDHQVLEEIRRGYRIKEKLLRPALVRIASNVDQVSE